MGRVLRDGLDGNFREEGLSLCIQSQLECLRGWGVHNLLWQLVPVRDHSNAERMLATTGFTTTSKPNAGGGSKDCGAWKVEKAVHYIEHVNKVTTDSSTD